VSPVRYELSFYIPEEGFFAVTALKTSNLTSFRTISLSPVMYVRIMPAPGAPVSAVTSILLIWQAP
jgi:hypothetical protein